MLPKHGKWLGYDMSPEAEARRKEAAEERRRNPPIRPDCIYVVQPSIRDEILSALSSAESSGWSSALYSLDDMRDWIEYNDY